jgi:hypothetical protein
MYVHCIYHDIVCTYTVYTCIYLTISAQDVLILTTKAVDHVNNMGNTCVMEPEPAFLAPFV